MVLVNQLIQRSMVIQLIRICGIDVVHQPMPVSPKAPSSICGIGAPVIIGPMNGGMDYPGTFRRSESPVTRASVFVGRLSASFINRLIAGKRQASVLLVANERTRLALPSGVRGKVVELPETGVDLSIWSPSASPETALASRFVFIGRLVHWKRLDFVLRALVDCPSVSLDVIWDGPMRGTWAATAVKLGVANRVNWVGWLPQRECAKRLQGATALVLPSIYECGGAVVLEAMACAVPVIALAWGGPADYIDESCGILVAPSDEQSIIEGFFAALLLLSTGRALQAKLGAAGRKRVELHFDWNRKIERILEIYRGILAERNTSFRLSGATS